MEKALPGRISSIFEDRKAEAVAFSCSVCKFGEYERLYYAVLWGLRVRVRERER